MHIFGLTGGIASGKSTVARRLQARGVPVIDADELAREVVAPGTPGLDAVVRAFGNGILGEDGALDRKALGRIVFADDEKRRLLNSLTHPRIAALAMDRARRLAESGAPLACYEAALLVENGLADAFRPLVVVSSPEAVQVARMKARDAASEEDARARIAAQTPLEKKVALADFVIANDGTLADLIARTDDAFDAVCAKLGVDVVLYPRPPAAHPSSAPERAP